MPSMRGSRRVEDLIDRVCCLLEGADVVMELSGGVKGQMTDKTTSDQVQ